MKENRDRTHMNQGHHEEHAGHHIFPVKSAFIVWGALMVLTIITVVVARFDLGMANFAVAMLVATIKAMLVLLYFMGLKYDHKENAVIFGASILFVAIFMILTFTDLLSRGDVGTHGQPLMKASAGGPAKFKTPWVQTPEMVAHGKELFTVQCASCHGDQGQGNGPASGSLNPKPRNFTVDAGWVNGRKSSEIFQTLTKGLNSMPSFATSPAEDRWSLAYYVQTFGSPAPKDTPADYAKAGVDISKPDGGLGSGPREIPISFAIERMLEEKKIN
jgi:caa(3)-type oxidase subunit IV